MWREVRAHFKCVLLEQAQLLAHHGDHGDITRSKWCSQGLIYFKACYQSTFLPFPDVHEKSFTANVWPNHSLIFQRI